MKMSTPEPPAPTPSATTTAAKGAMSAFYQWYKGLDCADAPEAGFFEEQYDCLLDAEKQGDAALVDAARVAVKDTLRYLHPSDHDEWLALAAALAVEVPHV